MVENEMKNILIFLRKRTGALKWLLIACVVCAVVFDCFADRHGSHFWGDHIRGFWSLFGLAGALFMIFAFKWIGHVCLTKETGYYD